MTKDENYWLNVAYVVGALLCAFIGYKVLQTVGIQTGWGEKYVEWYPTASTLLGVAFGGLLTWSYVKQPGRREYHINVLKELTKVTWPSFDDTKRMTWVVVVVVAFFSIVLFAFDLGWAWVLRQILT